MAFSQVVEYRPLDSNSIRLFRFDNSAQDIISGEMKSFTLEESPPYYALSYCWGPRTETARIRVNGGDLQVSRSLNDALERLHQFTVTSDDLPHSAIWIWADQLCINQQNIAERSKQVPLMGTIYKQAIRTIVWLGDDSDSNSPAWTLVDKIYDIFRERYPQAQTLADIPFAVYSESEFKLSGLPKWDDTKWHHFKNLLGIPWFTRVWVIQEVALSAKDPIILHGQHQYPWHKLSWAAAWLRRRGYTRLESIPGQLLNVDAISCIRRSKTPWALDVLLCLTAKFQATDQRDKIYGLLGLTKEGQDITNLPDELRPDYGLNVVETYKKVALYIFTKYKNLATLTRANKFPTSEGTSPVRLKHVVDKLPSWVPNWSDSVVMERQLAKNLSWVFHSHETDEGILGFPSYYKACGGRPLQIHQSENPSTLRLDGLWADTVVRSVRPTDGMESGGSSIDDCQTMIWKTASPLLSMYGAAEWLTSYIKATTAGHHIIGGRTETQIMRDGSAYLLGLLSRNENLTTIDSTNAESTSELIYLLQSLSIGGDAEVYTSISYNFCFQRSFFVTMQGRTGIGPLVTEPGDQIAILLGGEVPYVMRSQDSVALLLGESYVHGLMQGEMVQGLRMGKLAPEVIEIH